MNGQAALALLRAEKHISTSALTSYLSCPRQYQHRYLLKTPSAHRPGALVFGSAVHTSLALFYGRLMEGEPEPTAEELEAAFADAWKRELRGGVPVLLDDGETEASAQDKGVKLVRTFHEQAARPYKVLAVEDPFSIQLTDPPNGEVLEERLVGVFDAVVGDQDQTCRVLEHKTGARRWSEDRIAFDHQVTAYTLAAPLMGFGEAEVSIQLLLKTKNPALEVLHPTRTERDRRDLLQVIAGVLSAINAGAFYPVRDWHCRGCAYAGPCLAG